MIRVTVLVSLVILVVGITLWSVQRRLIYPGAWIPVNLTMPMPPDVEAWWMDTEDGRVEAWLIPGRGATAENPGPAVIFLHGNGEVIDMWPQEMSRFAEAGYTVLLPEYRGFGRSGGKPSEEAIGRDMVAWRDKLVALDTVDPAKIVYYGRSLGGGFAARLTRTHPPAALILGSGFTSLADAAHDLMRVPRFMVRDRLPVAEVLRDFDDPTLLLHGDRDEVIPLQHARRNAEAAQDATLVIYEDTGHNDMPRGHARWEDIDAFLQAHGLPGVGTGLVPGVGDPR